jgi:hypothetical protein
MEEKLHIDESVALCKLKGLKMEIAIMLIVGRYLTCILSGNSKAGESWLSRCFI